MATKKTEKTEAQLIEERQAAKAASRKDRADRQAKLGKEVDAIKVATDLQGVKDAVAHLDQFDRNALDGAFKQKIDAIVDAHIGAG